MGALNEDSFDETSSGKIGGGARGGILVTKKIPGDAKTFQM